jgi:invasion protein IalB
MNKLLFSVFVAAFAAFANAESPDAKTSQEYFQDWQLVCSEVDEQRRCSVRQSLSAKNGPVIAMINVLRDQDQLAIEFALPLMMDLTSRMIVKVDERGVGSYPYSACNAKACFILRKDDQNLLDQFKRGTEAVITAKSYSGNALTMNVSLRGFLAAVTELESRTK